MVYEFLVILGACNYEVIGVIDNEESGWRTTFGVAPAKLDPAKIEVNYEGRLLAFVK